MGNVTGGSEQPRVDPQVDTRVEAFTREAELGPVASALRASRHEILQRWLAAARQQPFHASQPDRAVADHIPPLFDALVGFLERSAPLAKDPEAPMEDSDIRDAASAHARARFAQGLDPPAVLTEFRILRQEIGRALRGHSDASGDLLAAELLVHDALDGAVTLGLAALEAHEAERSRLRAELAAIVDSSADAIWTSRLDGVVTSWNAAAERLYGYTAAEAIGQSMDRLIPADRQDELANTMERVSRGERIPPYETVRVRKDGGRVPVSVSVSPIFDASGAIVAASGIARDITDQKAVEQALRLRSDLLEAAHEAIFAWSVDGRITFWNRGAVSQYGWTVTEAVGLYSHELLGTPPDQVGAFVVALERSGRWDGELSHTTRDGRHIIVDARLAVVDRDADRYVVAASRDVTEQRRLQREAQEEVRLREQLLAVVAHDLRVPLTAIKGTADVLQRQVATGRLDPNRLADQAARISQASADMASQIAEVLDAARLRSGQALTLEPSRTDLVALAYRVASQAQVGANDHTISVETTLRELVGEWDGARLERVLGNLIGNAIKYSPEGGSVRVLIERERRANGEWASVAVIDRGVGIPTADLRRVFDRYYRAGNVVGRFPGEGIGLSGALHIAQQHGGTIDVESELGRGSIFTLRLPLVDHGSKSSSS